MEKEKTEDVSFTCLEKRKTTGSNIQFQFKNSISATNLNNYNYHKIILTILTL